MRADGTLPDDPLLHVCAVTFASHMTLPDSTLLAHGKAWGTGSGSVNGRARKRPAEHSEAGP